MSKGGGGGSMQGGYRGGSGQQRGGYGNRGGSIVANNYGQQGGYGQPRVPVGQGGMYSRMGAQSSMGGKGGRSPSGYGQQGGYRGGFGGFGGMQAPPPRSGLRSYGQQQGGFGGYRPSPAPNFGQIGRDVMGRGAKGGPSPMGGGQRYQAPYMPSIGGGDQGPIGTGIPASDVPAFDPSYNGGIAGGIKLSEGETPITGGPSPFGEQVSQQPMDENTRRRMESGMTGTGVGPRPDVSGVGLPQERPLPPHLDPNLGARQREMQRNNPAPAYNPNEVDTGIYRGGSKGFYDRNPGQLLDPASLYSDPNMGSLGKNPITLGMPTPPQQTSEVAQPLINEADIPPLRHVNMEANQMSRPQRAQGIASMLQPSPYRPQSISDPARRVNQIQQMPRQQVGRGRAYGR